MIEIKEYCGRLGNHLFMYAFARVVAEALAYRLVVPPIAGFDGTYDVVDGEAHTRPIHYIGGDYAVDLPALLANKRPRRILLNAYVQNYAYFAHRAADVKKWLHPGPPRYHYTTILPQEKDIVVHVRLGDYVAHKLAPAMEYYTSILDTIHDGRRVYVVSDEPDHPALAVFDKYDTIYHSTTALEHFRFLAAAKTLIIGTSTFSWWAAFLSDAQVFAPLLARGYYFTPDHKNEQYVVNESRYVYIDGVRMLDE